MSYDRWNKQADRIYRLDAQIKFGGNHLFLAVAPPLAGPSMIQDYPEVEQYIRFRYYGGVLMRKGDMNIRENSTTYADSTIFDVFTLPMIAETDEWLSHNFNTYVVLRKGADAGRLQAKLPQMIGGLRYLVSAAGRAGGVNPFSFNSLLISVIALSN